MDESEAPNTNTTVGSFNMTCNNSFCFNETMEYDNSEGILFFGFERYIRVIIPIIFGLIVVLGLVGNLLVIIVIVMNKQMRSTTNILIFNLAVADLCFIIFCVPFTATGYAVPVWPFGEVWCKIVQYMMYVCCYSSVYTLVVMSFDRYLAVVHPISSMAYRTQINTMRVVVILWIIIIVVHIPILLQVETVAYNYYGNLRKACLNKAIIDKHFLAQIFFGSFFAFGYVLPLSLICILYGFMLKRLLYGVVPGGSQRVESIRSKKRVTRMVVIVVVIFALCWLPIQIIFMIQNFGYFPQDVPGISAQMAGNAIAYMNSCVNPILYAFLSENFRRSFKKLLCCGSSQYTKFEYERTNIHQNNKEDVREKTYTQASTNTSSMSLQTYANNHQSKNGNEAINNCSHTDV